MRIQRKLFLASLVGSSLLVGIMFLLMQWSVDRGMLDYVNTKQAEQLSPVTEALSDYYAGAGSWQGLKRNPRLFHAIITNTSVTGRGTSEESPPTPRFNDRPRGFHPPHGPPRTMHQANFPPPPPGDGGPLVLVGVEGEIIIGRMRKSTEYLRLPVRVNESLVGELRYPKRERITEDYELNFIQQQREAFALISMILLGLAVLTSLPLARHFVSPLKKLAMMTEALTKGDYSQRADDQRNDEIGQLARDFNHLNKTLEQNELARKRWLADTSHELRTPIAILRGELEAMLDGVRPIGAQFIQSAHQEVMHLGKLVDDLHELSNADIGGMKYKMAEVDMSELLEECCFNHRSRFQDQNLDLILNAVDGLEVWGDETRLTQLVHNLLNNSLKYTDKEGRTQVSLSVTDDCICLRIEDTAPSVPDEALPYLFDYLYRVEESRNRRTGGSGLGLAICQRIVEAHQGNIHAEHSSLGGLAVIVSLPIRKQQ